MIRFTTATLCALSLTLFSLSLAPSAFSAPANPTLPPTLPPAVPVPSTPSSPANAEAQAKIAARNRTPSRLKNRRAILSRKAMQFRNARYRFGSASPNATDCSGLTMQLYRALGIKLPRSSKAQFRFGQPIARKALLPGDLVFFRTGRGGISHVGMFIGNGKMIHAANPRKGVRVDSISDRYYGPRYAGARRIISDGPPQQEVNEVIHTAQTSPEKISQLTGTARVLD